MNQRDDHAIETLRISDRDKMKLLWALEEASKQAVDSERRRLRVTWLQHEVTLTLLGDTGSSVKTSVLARNLSRWGVGLVHGRYVYPNTRCEVQIRALDGTWHVSAGKVGHVRHVQGLVHEMGVYFDTPIDLTNFAVLTPDEETRHLQELADDLPEEQAAEVTELASRVLVVDDFASDRKLLGHWLSRAGMAVSTVADSKSARERIDETQFDILVVDYRLGAEVGSDLIRSLRNAQFVAPILAISADDDEEVQAANKAAGADRFLAKPMTAATLTFTVKEMMGFDADQTTEPIFSTFKNESDMRPLLTEFTRGLAGYMEQLREANARHDYELLDQIARTLKGAGSGYGFDDITQQAAQLLDSLNDTAADIEKIKHSANDLICVLNRIKMS